MSSAFPFFSQISSAIGAEGGSITSEQITDATTIGKSILTATNAAAVWGDISTAAIGVTATTAMAGNAKPATAVLADNATKLATARAISLTGGATGTANFDGSAPAPITVTLAAPVGTTTRGGVFQGAAVADVAASPTVEVLATALNALIASLRISTSIAT